MQTDLAYFLNGASLMFFLTAAVRTTACAARSGSRPHKLFALCLIWMTLVELKEYFISYDPAYEYEVLGPAYTFPDVFTLPLLSLFFFELVMPGRITPRYALRLLAPFLLLTAAYWAGSLLCTRVQYASLGDLLGDLPAFLPTVLLLYVLYAAGYCVFALVRIVRYSIRYGREIAEAYSFDERIHLRWMRWMSAVLAVYLLSYMLVIAFTSSPFYTNCIYLMSLAVWGVLYGCIQRYRIPEIIRGYWRSDSRLEAEAPADETVPEHSGRIEALRQKVDAALRERRLYLNPGLTIVDMAMECGTNRTHLSQFFNNELGTTFRDYINRCRIRHAEELMRERDHKIEEVALLSGFGSATTFYRAFAKERNTTPQRWIESLPARGGELRLFAHPRLNIRIV